MTAKRPPTGEILKPGMDHPHHPFWPMPKRPRLAWPDGARVAYWVLLHLEYWELDPPEDAVRDPRFSGEFGSYFPDYRSWTQRDYGNRVGIYRLMRALDQRGLRATALMSSFLVIGPFLSFARIESTATRR